MQLILGTDDTETNMSAIENETISNGNIEDIKKIYNPKEKQADSLVADKENVTEDNAVSDNEDILNYILNETSDVVNDLESEEKESRGKENISETVENEDCSKTTTVNTHNEIKPVKCQDVCNVSDTLADGNKELVNTQINSNDNVDADKTSDYDEMLGIQQELLDTQTCKDNAISIENSDSHNQNGESEKASHMKVTNEDDSVSKENVTNGLKNSKSNEFEEICEKVLDEGYRESDSIENLNDQNKETNSVKNEDNDLINNDMKEVVEDVIKTQEILDETDSMFVESNLSKFTSNKVGKNIVENSEQNISLEDNVSVRDDLKVDNTSMDVALPPVIENIEKTTTLQNDSNDDIMDVDEVVESNQDASVTDVTVTSSDQQTQANVSSNMNVQESVDVKITDNILSNNEEVTEIVDNAVSNIPISNSEKAVELVNEEIKVRETCISDQSTELKDDNMDVQELNNDINLSEKELSDKQELTEVKDNTVSNIPICDPEVKTKDGKVTEISSDQSTEPIELKDDMDDVQEIVDDVKDADEKLKNKQEITQVDDSTVNTIPICKLSNTLDILSDDEDEPPKKEEPKQVEESIKEDSKCIDLVDDDDIMVVEENKTVTEKCVDQKIEEKPGTVDTETGEKTTMEHDDLFSKKEEKETPKVTDSIAETKETPEIDIDEKPKTEAESKPLLPKTFLKSAKKNLADMTREDLEEFCILKIVESIVDRSNLGELKNRLKSMEQTMEEAKKKAAMLTKQNRDLQVVLKSVQEEQKKRSSSVITPLKITRSVGMQVVMEKSNIRRKPTPNTPNRPSKNAPVTSQSPQRQQKTPNSQYIPVPRLVPAGSPATKSPQAPVQKVVPNGVKTISPNVKPGEKRQHKAMSADTVDLTDDEPPAKVNPVRLVSPKQLMPPQRQPFGQAVNGPRKVFIPINGQNQNAIRPGQTIMLKSVPPPGNVRPRGAMPQMTRLNSPSPRMNRVTSGRHPAPLPDSAKQYQPPNWKNLPPAPDLKLSKVENGIVISWKIDGYAEDSHEEIASYQLYAYQETSSPPSTSLWKKIGDVKALPLPMACTLTQFMAGFKYYFAVRAVDVRSRLGPFSLPGSILLLNKL